MAQLHTVCLHSTSARSPWEPTCRPGSSRHDCSHAQHIWLKSPANIDDCTKVTLKKKKGKKKQQKHNTSVLSTDCVWWALRGSAPATKACCQFSGVPVSTFALTVTCKDSGWIPDSSNYSVSLRFSAGPNQRYCLLKSYCVGSKNKDKLLCGDLTRPTVQCRDLLQPAESANMQCPSHYF